VTIISLILFKYTLVWLALYGLWESGRILHLNRGDLRILLRENVNGPKKLSTELRINQAQYLLAVFCVMLLVGLVQAVAPLLPLEHYAQPSVMVTRLGFIVLGGILIAKQRSVRRQRERLDGYYDQQQHELNAAKSHMHRRATDPPAQGE
jgi:hypothetical protein